MYERALNIIDKNKLTEEDIRTSELKVEILEALGRYKEALAFSREVVEHTKMLHDEAFNRQINQLRTLHDLNNQEMQAYELQLREQQLHTQRLLMIILTRSIDRAFSDAIHRIPSPIAPHAATTRTYERQRKP